MKFYVMNLYTRVMLHFAVVSNAAIVIFLMPHSSVGRITSLLFGIILIPTLGFVTWLNFSTTLRKVKISEHGVEYSAPFKHYIIKWEDMQNIGLLYYAVGYKPMIFFTTLSIEEAQKTKIGESHFRMAYYKKAEKEIMKYWDKPIR